MGIFREFSKQEGVQHDAANRNLFLVEDVCCPVKDGKKGNLARCTWPPVRPPSHAK